MIKGILIGILCAVILVVLGTIAISEYMRLSRSQYILTSDEAAELQDVDLVMVLGCQVKADGTLSHMLEDRVKMAVELYKKNPSLMLLMSGDGREIYYNEPDAMEAYAIEHGVPADHIIKDPIGLSTSESAYNAANIYKCKKIIIVTQGYHLPRSIYNAQACGIEAYGVDAAYRDYVGQLKWDIREILARVKDFFKFGVLNAGHVKTI
ncbi:MAG: YdcF family protein [Parasporobacterium sp.]|nr:YdcF family protein [Parasporobacterium sp.]